MSRSKRDQKGKRINNEIWGRNCYQVVDGKVFPDCGGEPVGSPDHKNWSKRRVARLRRAEDLRKIREGLETE